MEIVWLGHGNCHDCTLVGGKGANLCHLAATQRIPPAFCLTAAAFRDWLPTGGEVTALPAKLSAPLATAYRHLGDLCGVAELAVAVRSSAVDEDGQTVSFAGQHSTYLNVTGVAAVAKAVQHCWASAHATHALAYRQHHGLAIGDIPMAVLVQQMIPADVSAVVFSTNPVTGQQDEVVINASLGLGESLVSGAVTPDTWRVHKRDLTVVEVRLADKQIMTVPTPGGTGQRPVPRWLRTQPSLTPEQCLEVAQLAVHLERTMGWPVDLECAYRGGLLYLLQCRPITALQVVP